MYLHEKNLPRELATATRVASKNGQLKPHVVVYPWSLPAVKSLTASSPSSLYFYIANFIPVDAPINFYITTDFTFIYSSDYNIKSMPTKHRIAIIIFCFYI